MPVVKMLKHDTQLPNNNKCFVVPSEIADLHEWADKEVAICAFCGETSGRLTVFKKSLVCESCRKDLLVD